MNRTELIDYVADKAGISKSASSTAIDAFIDGITESLQKGDPVVLAKFGTFTVKLRAARQGRNPSTGEKITINAAKVVGFKAGKGLKDAVKDETAKENV